MSFLKNPHLDLTSSRIETERCVLVPFSLDGRVDIHELQREFCKANKDHFVSNFLPSYEEEIGFIRMNEEKIKRREAFENFILDKKTQNLIGSGGFRILESGELNIGIWIREDMQGLGYASETYRALIDWAREHTVHTFLQHSLDPRNESSRKLALKFGGILEEGENPNGHEIYRIPLNNTDI